MLKKKIEALLFSSGRRMSVEEIAGICNKTNEEVIEALHELKNTFTDDSSLMLVEEGNFWKLTPKEDYLHLVRQIVTKTELSKTLMETLAVIAYKYPIKQADLIKVRTNKAYDHLSELEEMGYITRQKYGRTKLLKLTQKFFDYFSLKEENLKEQFKDFDSIAKKIEQKEEEIKTIREEQKKKAKNAGKKGTDKPNTEIDLIDEQGHTVKLEVVGEPKEASIVKESGEKLDGLEVVNEPEQPQSEDIEDTSEATLTEESASDEISEEEPKGDEIVERRIKEIETETSDQEVEQRVQEIFHPKQEFEEDKSITEEDLYTASVESEEETEEKKKDEDTEEETKEEPEGESKSNEETQEEDKEEASEEKKEEPDE